MTGIDIGIALYKMLNVSAVTTLLGGGKVWQHNRPVNSPYTDVVVSLPVFDGNSRSVNYVDVNVHTPNLEGLYPVDGEDQTFPDLAAQKEIVDVILPLIVSTTGLYLSPAIKGVPIRDSDGQWYSNIRINLITMDEGQTQSATLEKVTSASDGYGGVTTTNTTEWTGRAEKLTTIEGNQMSTGDGVTDLNRRTTWRIPHSSTTPQKYHQLVTLEGVFTVVGIAPEGNVFWKLTTVREDGWN